MGEEHHRAGLHLYSSDRADVLAARLAGLLADDPLDPMTPEWLAVPTAGLRRWLMIELSARLGASAPGRHDGVVAHVVRARPGSLLADLLAATAEDGSDDRWDVERMVWELLAIGAAGGDDPGIAPFVHLPPGGSRYSRARRVADLFDRYHRWRPGMVLDWASGADRDGAGDRLGASHAWQPVLWRALRGRIGTPSPPERLPSALEGLRSGAVALDLPERLLYFGFTSLPGGETSGLLPAVAAGREVHVFLLEPVRFDLPALERRFPRPAGHGPRLRIADRTAELVANPLVRSWGRGPREATVLLGDAVADGLPSPVHLAPPEDGRGDTLLHRLQAAVRSGSVPDPRPADAADRSVVVHACYGDMRQVQVLRDAILHLLADETLGLREEDVVVLCPRLDRFAPLVDAVFGAAAGGEGPPSLRFRIADQSIRTSNPVFDAATALLDLCAGRFTATDVRDVLGLAPVAHRFGFGEDELAHLDRWIADTNIRWGVDERHRRRFGLDEGVTGFTWQAGLDRLVLGTVVGDDDLDLAVGGVAPYGIDGGEVEVLGNTVEALSVMMGLARSSEDERPMPEWLDLVREACAALFAVPPESSWQVRALESVLADAADHAAGSDVPCTFLDLRRFLGRLLDDVPDRPDFFRGGVTVTSMTPLGWVPFRVVCILGMDQDAFATTPSASEDLMLATPHLGDPDPRADDRQRLLEALLSAGDHLVVTRAGRDVRTNQEVRRSVVAAELVESVLALVPPHDRAALASRLEVHHPRHPFDEEALRPGALCPDVAWSFDEADRTAAVARARRPVRPPELSWTPLDVPEDDVIDLDDLRRFLAAPVPYFVRDVLGMSLVDDVEPPDDRIPLTLDGLATWGLGTRLVATLLADRDPGRWLDRERASSSLPPGSYAVPTVDDVTAGAGALTDAFRAVGAAPEVVETVGIDVLLTDGTRIVGAVPVSSPDPAPGPVRLHYSRAKPVHRLEAWLDLVALAAADPSRAWRSVVVARPADEDEEDRVGPAVVLDLRPRSDGPERADEARWALERMVDCYRRGRREPIPLFPTLSYHVYRQDHVERHWRTFGGWGDGTEPAVALAFGDASFRSIMGLVARPGDPGSSGGRVARYAGHLWSAYDRTVAEVPDPAGGAPADPGDPDEAGR